ncbi:hypothetical protein [Actinomadura sp. NPDC000600]
MEKPDIAARGDNFAAPDARDDPVESITRTIEPLITIFGAEAAWRHR